MADIQQYLDNIANAEKGEDVRWSIHDGIEAINNEVVANTTASNNAVAQATAASTASQQSAASAAESAEAANATNEQYNVFINMPINRNTFIKEQNLGSVFTDEIISQITSGTFSDITIGSTVGDWTCVHINYANSKQNVPYATFMVLKNLIDFADSPISDISKGYLGCKLFTSEEKIQLLENNLAQHGLTGHLSKNPLVVPTILSANSMSYSTVLKEYAIPSVYNIFGVAGIGCRDVSEYPYAGQFSLFKLGGSRLLNLNKDWIYTWSVNNIDGVFNSYITYGRRYSGVWVPSYYTVTIKISGYYLPYISIVS